MFTGSLGGPIKRDKMWFLVAARHQSSDEIITDVPVQITAPDGEFINSYLDTYVRGPSLRLTWQAAPKHKLASFVQRWWKRKGKDFGAGQDPRASQFRDPKHAHHTVGNVRWTSPLTNRLLFEAGYSWTLFDWLGAPMPGVEQPRGTPLWYVKTQKDRHAAAGAIDECAFTAANSAVAGCTTWGSNQIQRQDNTRHVFQGVVSYVTGSHSFKFGYNHEIGPDGRMGNTHNGDLYQNYTAGQPSSVDVWNTPLEAPGIVDYDAAFFLQDTWTIKRLTINPGLRIEWFSAGMRAASAAAGRFVPARFFPEERGLLKWGPDYAPRFAAAYDLFGDGRTALKTQLQQVPPSVRRRPGGGVLADRHHQRAAQLVRLRAERGRHRVLRRGGGRPTATASCRITRSVRAPRAARSARSATTRSAISIAGTTGSSRPASSIS